MAEFQDEILDGKKEDDCLDGDKLSLGSPTGSNRQSQSNGNVKETLLIRVKSFHQSFRGVREKNPSNKESKVNKGDKSGKMETNDDPERADDKVPPSPSLSTGSNKASPLKFVGELFQRNMENGTTGPPPTQRKPLRHSRVASDTAIALGNSFIKKRSESFRRSLRLSGKKDKEHEKTPKQQEVLQMVTEASPEEVKRDEPERPWIRESYTLPEIPLTPLSVMEINKLIEMEVLEEAHLNLLSLRQEFQQEQEGCPEVQLPMALAKKEKDLSLLYGTLRDKVKTIVRDSSSMPSRNKDFLVAVSRIIQEEEKRERDPGGMAGWREAWREAVGEGVQVIVGGVHLDERESSWLAVHLGLLGRAIVEDLEKVKKELQSSYPPSFKVFSTYVTCYHAAVHQHLRKLQQKVVERRDLYALLDWILKRYQSERIMGNMSLRPEMNGESRELPLEEGFLSQLKRKYCDSVKEQMRSSLEKIVELERDDFWMIGKSHDMEEGIPISEFHRDAWQLVKSNIVNARDLDSNLEMEVAHSCLEELKQFPKRFETQFKSCCTAMDTASSLWAEYHIAYINSFTALNEHMEEYRVSCPNQVDGFNREVNWLLVRLGQVLEDQYKNDVKPYLRRMMTRKWLRNDEDFQKLCTRTEVLSKHCDLMRPPHVQTLVSALHFHVVKEYISQLMKNNYSCKNRKNERAADKIRQQWGRIRELFEDMESVHEWLHPAGEHLSDIIGQKDKRKIKNQLQPLVKNYPDISKKHLSAVLYFRGLVGGQERQRILRQLTDLKKAQGPPPDRSKTLFADMPVPNNTNCMPGLPFSCLSFLVANN